MEEMQMPCSEDMCDGDGILHYDNGTDGARDHLCLCNPRHTANREYEPEDA